MQAKRKAALGLETSPNRFGYVACPGSSTSTYSWNCLDLKSNVGFPFKRPLSRVQQEGQPRMTNKRELFRCVWFEGTPRLAIFKENQRESRHFRANPTFKNHTPTWVSFWVGPPKKVSVFRLVPQLKPTKNPPPPQKKKKTRNLPRLKPTKSPPRKKEDKKPPPVKTKQKNPPPQKKTRNPLGSVDPPKFGPRPLGPALAHRGGRLGLIRRARRRRLRSRKQLPLVEGGATKMTYSRSV